MLAPGKAKPSAKIGPLIEDATTHKSEGNKAYLEICQIINSCHDGPKEAAKCIRKRFATRNPEVVKPTLELLDTCVRNCGKRFHVQVASKDFLNEFLKIIKPKYGYSEEIQSAVLDHLQTWALAFQHSGDMNEIVKTYADLKNKNMEFPPIDPSKPPEVFISVKEVDNVSMCDTVSVMSGRSGVSGRSAASSRSGYSMYSGISETGSFLSPVKKADRSPSPRYRITETIEVEENAANGFLTPASTKRAQSRSPCPRMRVAEPAERSGKDNFLAPASGKSPRGSRSPSPMFQVLAPASVEDNPQNSFLAPASLKTQRRDRSPSPRYRIVAPVIVDESETNNFLCPASAKNKGHNSPKHQSPSRFIQSEPQEAEPIGSELKKFREKSLIFVDLLSSVTPGSESNMDWELLTDMHSACRRVQQRIMQLLATQQTGGHTVELLKINDELGGAFVRYDQCQKAAIEQMSGNPATGANHQNKAEEHHNAPPSSIPTIQIVVDDLVNVVGDESNNNNKFIEMSLSDDR